GARSARQRRAPRSQAAARCACRMATSSTSPSCVARRRPSSWQLPFDRRGRRVGRYAGLNSMDTNAPQVPMMSEPQPTISEPGPVRRVPLEGCLNFRDLGGYPAAAGGATRWGRIFRADALSRLTPAAIELLVGQGLRTVVDLRRPRELAAHPCAFVDHATVVYHHNPVRLDDTTALDEPERLRLLDFRAHYITMIRDSGETF